VITVKNKEEKTSAWPAAFIKAAYAFIAVLKAL